MPEPTQTAKALESACGIFLKDLQALPEEAFTKNFGGKTRTVADIVYEVNLVNDHVGLTLRGEELFDWPDGGWITAPADFQTKDVVVSAFENSTKKIIETANAYTDADLETTVETERGPKTRAERIRFMTLHLWYHGGQLNFIQALLGDDAWHWG